MPSELKSETARTNGAKSRGPKSAATREKSSLNATRHGFTSCNTILLKCEDPELYQEVRSSYIAAYQPVSAAEEGFVDEMVVARWRITRLWTIETALFDREMERQITAARQDPSNVAGPEVHLALAFRTLADESRCLALLSRYESRLYRIHERAYRSLRQMQLERTADPRPESARVPPPPDSPVGMPVPRPASESVEKKCETNQPAAEHRLPAGWIKLKNERPRPAFLTILHKLNRSGERKSRR